MLPIFEKLTKKIKEQKFLQVSGLVAGSKAFFLLGLAEKLSCPIFVLTNTEGEIEELTEDLEAFLVEKTFFSRCNIGVISLPAKSSVEQIMCLNQILENKISILVASPEALEISYPKKENFLSLEKTIEVNQKFNRNEFAAYLTDAGYEPVDFVEQPGEYSLRGEIIDLWSANFTSPLRIILSGEIIEEIRLFDVNTQRTKTKTNKAKIIPARLVGGRARLVSREASLAEYLPSQTLIFWDEQVEAKKEFRRFKQVKNLTLPAEESFNFGAEELPNFNAKFTIFLEEVKNWLKQNYQIYLFAENISEQEKISELLEEKMPEVGLPILLGGLNSGFILPEDKLIFVSGYDIFARYKIRQRLPKFRGGIALEHLSEIKPGDYIVHERYGIGIYRGLEHLAVEGKYSDFLHLEYKGNDKLYIPITDFRSVQKYIGHEGYKPRLYSLDGISWERIKEKVKKSLYNFARELLQIYAQRQVGEGYSYLPDSYIEKEFAASFPYEETPDQAKAIEEVKNEMLSPRPMDSLVIGDVGYGKTEVAMRAALKAALAGRQTAVLVPTTILAEQHYHTFSGRFAKYPVNIEMLSRFRTSREQKKIIADLKKGLIDIIIGTHRLLQKDIEFYDLGLVIIDEEHRFGVRAKEKLKKLRATIDILTLSATPIPRTLSMVLSGIREVSTIETPPEGRLAIETYIGPYNEELIKNAIFSEMDRQGQVFYVHNRIETILNLLSRLKNLLPGIKFGLAHGQMLSRELEKTMHKFLAGEYDVLVSTSIIESGLDLPQVNTLIVEKAEEFGLAQLYQLRGRVGRGNQKAYCYLLYTPDSPLTETAVKRLRTLYEFSTLGSGLRLALRDLEIRGAGNILGPQQHGFMSEVGYDLYYRLLEEEVKKLKGEAVVKEEEPVFDFPLEAYFPQSYIPNSSVRIIFYKRILTVNSENELADLKNELEDRFGKIPQIAENLFSLSELRLLAKKIKISEIKGKDKLIEIHFSPEAEIDSGKIKKFTLTYPDKISFAQEKGLKLNLYNFPQEGVTFFLKKYLLTLI